MQWTDKIRRMKLLLVAAAVVIAVASLVVSHLLVRDLAREEQARVEVWAQAMRCLQDAGDDTDLSLVLSVLNGNNTIPVVVLDSEGRVQDWRNVDERHVADVAASGNEIRVDQWRVRYAESVMLRRLAVYPYVQMGVVLVFVLVAIFALLSSKRAEQNRVWVGLSKETAHQLGTPISSLMAWAQVLRDTYPQDELIPEMQKDVSRLQRVAERFSKIGSLPEPRREDLGQLLSGVTQYIRRRASHQVTIDLVLPTAPLYARLCAPLFEWVVENLCKNAIDAMDGRGSIVVTAGRDAAGGVWVEVADTGRGIPPKHFKSVFQPGFTTKSRGWGLGLSLARRIVEQYHGGRIWVKSSQPDRGTTFRVDLPA